MVISLILLFVTCLSLTFIEERLKEREKVFLYVIMGIVMVLIAGLREAGSTPDSLDYEDMYYGKANPVLEELTEPSFRILSFVLNAMSLGVNALFTVYAIISLSIHMSAFWKISKLPFLTLTIYISYYYMMHDMVQIRCAVASALFIWAMYYRVEHKHLQALGCILIGTLFHFSAAAGLVIFVLSDNMSRWIKTILYMIVPIGLVAYFTQLDISYLVPEELGGEKLEAYRLMRDKGMEDDLAGWPLEINILIWMNIVLYYASIFYSEHLTKYCKYVPIAIKVQAVGFICLFFLHGVSAVLGNRLNDYFSVASILLWTASVYAFYPLVMGKVINNIVSSIRFVTSMLAYALSLYFM